MSFRFIFCLISAWMHEKLFIWPYFWKKHCIVILVLSLFQMILSFLIGYHLLQDVKNSIKQFKTSTLQRLSVKLDD